MPSNAQSMHLQVSNASFRELSNSDAKNEGDGGESVAGDSNGLYEVVPIFSLRNRFASRLESLGLGPQTSARWINSLTEFNQHMVDPWLDSFKNCLDPRAKELLKFVSIAPKGDDISVSPAETASRKFQCASHPDEKDMYLRKVNDARLTSMFGLDKAFDLHDDTDLKLGYMLNFEVIILSRESYLEGRHEFGQSYKLHLSYQDKKPKFAWLLNKPFMVAFDPKLSLNENFFGQHHRGHVLQETLFEYLHHLEEERHAKAQFCFGFTEKNTDGMFIGSEIRFPSEYGLSFDKFANEPMHRRFNMEEGLFGNHITFRSNLNAVNVRLRFKKIVIVAKYFDEIDPLDRDPNIKHKRKVASNIPAPAATPLVQSKRPAKVTDEPPRTKMCLRSSVKNLVQQDLVLSTPQPVLLDHTIDTPVSLQDMPTVLVVEDAANASSSYAESPLRQVFSNDDAEDVEDKEESPGPLASSIEESEEGDEEEDEEEEEEEEGGVDYEFVRQTVAQQLGVQIEDLSLTVLIGINLTARTNEAAIERLHKHYVDFFKASRR